MIVYKCYLNTTIVIYVCLFQVLQDTRGSRGRMPNTIHKALCSQACHGNIFIKTSNAVIETYSHHGLVDFPSNMFGFNVWRLTTNGGNITVKKQEK